MIVVSTRVPVADVEEGAYEQRFYDRAGLLERHPGFVRQELLRPTAVIVSGVPAGHANAFLVLTYWESAAHFVAWAESEDFARAHAQRAADDPFSGPVAYEVHEVIRPAA
jgi:heme-degrading monooxygenase HmoA